MVKAPSGFPVQLPYVTLGQINLVGRPVTLSRTPSSLVTGGPEYGEHTDIFAEFGYSAADVARLRTAGTI